MQWTIIQFMKPIILFLTCANEKEAARIEQTLLEKKLVCCVKKSNTTSTFLWKGKIESSGEVLLIMDSLQEKFKEIDKEVKRLHSYETYVLVATPVTHTTEKVKNWLR